jgi:hypothetical protein
VSDECREDLYSHNVQYFDDSPEANTPICPNCGSGESMVALNIIHLLVGDAQGRIPRNPNLPKGPSYRIACKNSRDRVPPKTVFTIDPNASTCYDCLKIAEKLPNPKPPAFQSFKESKPEPITPPVPNE